MKSDGYNNYNTKPLVGSQLAHVSKTLLASPVLGNKGLKLTAARRYNIQHDNNCEKQIKVFGAEMR
jgi:hypothetical protein